MTFRLLKKYYNKLNIYQGLFILTLFTRYFKLNLFTNNTMQIFLYIQVYRYWIKLATTEVLAGKTNI